MTLYKRINALPTVLQDIIYEYYVDHRPVVKTICKELLTAYQSRLFRFTFDRYICDCDEVHDDPYYRDSYYSEESDDIESYNIKKFNGHYYTFCSEVCENIYLYDLRKYHYRRNRIIDGFVNYKTEIKKFLCLKDNCNCYMCEEYKEFEKDRKEGVDGYDEELYD